MLSSSQPTLNTCKNLQNSKIRNLAELGVDQNVIDRMTQKYNRMLTDHGNTCNKIRDEVYREVRGVKAELAEKETIIRVLTTHIREKELL